MGSSPGTPDPAGSIVYVTRDGPGSWPQLEIAVDSGQECASAPQWEGQLCNYDYVRHRLIDVVTTHAGELRFLYTRTHYVGVLTGFGSGWIGDPFYWKVTSDSTTSDLVLGWVDDSGLPQAKLVVPNCFAGQGAASVDSLGRIHAIVYEWVPGQDPDLVSVRYLRLDV